MKVSCLTSIWEILIPSHFNDGSEVNLDHHNKWDEWVLDIANGLTVLKPAKGRWIDLGGKRYTEPMIPVRIACTEDEIIRVAKFTKDHYEQIKVMFYRIADKVYIYP